MISWWVGEVATEVEGRSGLQIWLENGCEL